MEPDRIWHDPVVEVRYTQTSSYLVSAAQLKSMTWPTGDGARLIETISLRPTTHGSVRPQIRTYSDKHQEPPPQNTVQTTSAGSPTTSSFTDEHLVR
ncbi:hypothetical protein VTK73DRAFT_1473 [Phialemonium thermophilum]|uniref:Uncharacterized protein n=1 Tax=Phialemonium thermophilum TaxID=223376 RepID=A0ABR3X940_9PEZI